MEARKAKLPILGVPSWPPSLTSSPSLRSLSLSLSQLSTEATLANVLASGADAACLFFWAEFDPASKRGGQMDKVYSALLAKHPEVTCVKVDAEAMEDLADQYDVQSVPTFIFVSGGAVLGKVAGANPPALAAMFASVAAKAAPSASAAAMIPAAAAAAADADASSAQAALNARLRRLTSAARVMVFMKGSPQEPKCKVCTTRYDA